MTDVLVHHAQLLAHRDRSMWVLDVEAQHDDGTVARRAYVLPEDTFEWRAAEYGLDPVKDLDEIHEIVLYEWMLDHDGSHPHSLHEAPTIDHARARLRERVRHLKGAQGQVRGVVGTPPPSGHIPGAALIMAATDTDDPLEVVKRHSRIDPALMEIKQAKVARDRAERRTRRLAAATRAPDRPSPAALRALLLGEHPRHDTTEETR